MAILFLQDEQGLTQRYPLERREITLGRQSDCDVHLNAREVSRRHARLISEGDTYFIEDLGSSNGTFVNNRQVLGRESLHDQDRIQIGPFLLEYQARAPVEEKEVVILASEPVMTTNTNLFRLDASRKLQIVLDIAQQLAHSLDFEEILPKLLDQLLTLFTQAERGMVIMIEADQPRVHIVRTRHPNQSATPNFSRSVVQRVLKEGVGIVAEDAQFDSRFQMTQTLSHLGIRSFVCVPLKTRNTEPIGVVILDRFGIGNPFTTDDLHLLTAISLQAAVVLENAKLHADLVEKARLERDIALARQIQEGFLPQILPKHARAGLEHFAAVYPAQEVAGDFYDYFPVGDDLLAFSVADIAGKGVPAALLMTGIRTLSRHLAQNEGATPAQVLQQINDHLAVDNPHDMFVTMVMGRINPTTGDLLLATAAHPPALVRRASGMVEEVKSPPCRLLGVTKGKLTMVDIAVNLAPGDTICCYTDGVVEAYGADRHLMFGIDRLSECLAQQPTGGSLESWGQAIKAAVAEFIRPRPPQDDITILLLRRVGQPAERA